MSFEDVYNRLNDEQKRAVDAIDGPLLVLAGPGTGKTQLLSARVANILRLTDTRPENILCLTFTDAAALNMRERLGTMIGEAAYDVHINTYHSFAAEIIKAYPDFFETVDLATGEDSRLERPINELGQLEVIKSIVDQLPFSDPLRSARYYLRSVVSTISDLKQANINPDELREIAKSNAEDSQKLSVPINELMSKAGGTMPRKAAAAIELFEAVLSQTEKGKGSLAKSGAEALKQALEDAEAENSTKPLTAWKNDWLQKDSGDNWMFGNPETTEKMLSLATIFERYQKVLKDTSQYDFNDMILTTIKAMNEKPELKFNLQERYQYILLDEFQDTNAVQFELVRNLAEHPVHEGRPNIMAVGDDDQGIFAFQGADIGNMVQFLAAFRDVEVINLIKNYRSHTDILHVAHNIAEQIESRLHHNLKNISKDIEAASLSLPAKATIARHEFNSQAAEYGWVADSIAELIKAGTDPAEIAVLAPKHVILETLVPFLNKKNLPVAYEKRENIFETEIVRAIILVCEFLRAAEHNQIEPMDELLPRVLSLDFWQVPVSTIWQLNWEHHDQHSKDGQTWVQRALKHTDTKDHVEFLLTLGSKTNILGLEQTLDFITGADSLEGYASPLKSYYFSNAAAEASPVKFYEAISHLSVIRAQLRDQQVRADQRLTIDGLLELYETYLEAEQPLINSHPIAQAESAVQLQTVYKAKGLEYEYVFLPFMHDDVWGGTATGSYNKISLPKNLKFIRHDSTSDDSYRRLLFVAITRAKHGLIATSHAQKETGKQNLPVKYMHESGDEERVSAILPPAYQQVMRTERPTEQLMLDVDTLWHSRHTAFTPSLKSLLKNRLSHYVMSPTHLNNFTNIEYAGPFDFLLNTLLRFPMAPSADSVYGDALHRALERFQKSGQGGKGWSIEQAVKSFEEQLDRGYLTPADKAIYADRGARALRIYLKKNAKRLLAHAEIEADFRREGCSLGDAVLTGKIDRLEVDKSNKKLTIIDYKSGKASTKWGSSPKHINYKHQLYFYTLLLETSSTYRGYRVEAAQLEFIEPLTNGEPAPPLVLPFNEKEYGEFKRLVASVWQHIQALDLPDISGYGSGASGMRKFITDLLT